MIDFYCAYGALNDSYVTTANTESHLLNIGVTISKICSLCNEGHPLLGQSDMQLIVK
jgi:hypothetical protein